MNNQGPNPLGLCMCGCGGITSLAAKTTPKYGTIKGEPQRFLTGHNERGCTGAAHNSWKGGRKITQRGYVKVMVDHPRADSNGFVYEHILVAEKSLGKPLPTKAVVHHVNEDRADNRPENFVICQDDIYHHLLHKRMRALRGCGQANWKSCRICKQWDDPTNMYVYQKNGAARHRECQSEYMKRRVANK